MARSTAKLRAVAPPTVEPVPDLSYEWQERQRIASKDWAEIHVRGDRATPFDWMRRVVRNWR